MYLNLNLHRGERVIHTILGRGGLASEPVGSTWDSEVMVEFDILPKTLKNPYNVILGDLRRETRGWNGS